MEVYGEEESLSVGNMGSYTLAKYVTGLMASPIQVVNILRQVEYAPSDTYLSKSVLKPTLLDDTDQDTIFDESASETAGDEDDDFQNVYADLASAEKPFHVPAPVPKVVSADAAGYLVRTGNDENDPTRPPFEVSLKDYPVMPAIGKISGMDDEGLISLWKGHFAGWLNEVGHMMIQPSVEQLLNDSFDIHDDTIPFIHLDNPAPTIATTVASHAISGILLSPLELIRTRLIVQTSNPYHRKYRGTFHCLRTIIKEEGFSALYWNRRLFPTVLYHTIAPFFRYATHFIIERWLQISPETRPLMFQLAELALNTIEMGILLPLETIRRRLECQVVSRMPQERPFETMVQCSRIPYTGMIDCAGRIIVEEGGARGSKGRRRAGKEKAESGSGVASWWGGKGFGSLYRGFRLRVISNAAIVILRRLSEEQD
ncbi:hypothetical protein HDU76_012432 [Blyttiomyces sp. JEL0837]|nr:hypothetical protein HDU76_012432 [Blyttiomyces sp. JEL0837]